MNPNRRRPSTSSSEDEASGNNTKQDILGEISKYRKEPNISKAGNLLHFWKKNEKRFPHLAKLARKYLCLMATSRTAERVSGSPLDKKKVMLNWRKCEQDFVFD